MLGDDLPRRGLDMSKSSFLGAEVDERKLKQMLEEREKTIRQLTKRIDRLEATSRRTTAGRAAEKATGRTEDNRYLEMLEAEMGRSRRLEEIIESMSRRIGQLLDELAQENSFTDSSEDLRQLLDQLDLQNSLSVSFDTDSAPHSLSISQDWNRAIDFLELALRTTRERANASQRQAASLAERLAEATRMISSLQERQDSEETAQLKAEVKEERRQREKLRGLLDKTEIEKNELINRINTIGLRECNVKAKTKEELVQYSAELNYRVRDLEREKEDILKTATRQQQLELKKYQNVLRQLRSIKDSSRMGNSA